MKLKNYTLLIISIFLFFACTNQNDEVVTISTQYGDIKVILFDKTPKHKANFLKLAKEKFYDSTAFHRVIDNFMVQGGDINSKTNPDPSSWGQGNPDYTIPLEVNVNLMHYRGAMAAARKPDQVNPNKESNGSQFYIVQNPQGEHRLNMKYTVFGQVISGMEVVDNIVKQSVNELFRPIKDIRIKMTVTPMKKSEITAQYGYNYPKE